MQPIVSYSLAVFIPCSTLFLFKDELIKSIITKKSNNVTYFPLINLIPRNVVEAGRENTKGDIKWISDSFMIITDESCLS